MSTDSRGTPAHPPDEGHPADAPDGRGAADAATRGLDAVLGREVAMVTLPPVQGEDLVVRIEQVRRLAGLHHAHLVEVFDVDGLAEDTESTLVLQSVDGSPLDPATDRSRWAPITVAQVGAQIASGLAHAHARGVVHGRIGPASVVLGGTVAAPYAWLTGFTAALRPAPPVDPGASDTPTPAPPHPADDVADLGRTLGVVLDPAAPAAPALEHALGDMAAGKIAARTAAETLARVAEALRHVDDDETGIVPLVVGPSAVPEAEAPVAPSGPLPSAVPVAPVPSPRAPSGRGVPARFGRRARLAGRGVQLAALGGAALTVAAASGLYLWTVEGPGTPREAGVSDQVTPSRPAAPPVAVAPPGPPGPGSSGPSEASPQETREDTYVRETTSRRSPITSDVTTLPAPVVPPVVPPTVPPTVAPTTSATTGPTTGPTSGPTTGPSSTTTTTPVAPGSAGAATLAAP